MAVQQVQNLPPQFIQDIGKDLATQITAQTGVPVVATGIAGIHNNQVKMLHNLKQDKMQLDNLV